jgi:hypothetical protein
MPELRPSKCGRKGVPLLALALSLALANGDVVHQEEVSEYVRTYDASTLEDGQRFLLTTQKNCPLRYKEGFGAAKAAASAEGDEAPEEVIDIAAQLADDDVQAEFVDCEDLVQMVHIFAELEVEPGFDGDFDKLDLQWGDALEEQFSSGGVMDGEEDDMYGRFENEGYEEGFEGFQGGDFEDWGGDEDGMDAEEWSA